MPPARRASTAFDAPDTPITAAGLATLAPTVVEELTDEQRAEARQRLIDRFAADVQNGALDADLPEVLTEENLGDIVDAALDAVVDAALADQTCPECGATVPDGEDTCPECGHAMASGTEAITIDPANPGGFHAVLCVERNAPATTG
jgi:hypothetical protein